MAIGRPSKYKPEYCESLIAHMKSGLSYESFGPSIGVNRDTLYQWEHTHDAFSDAKKRAVDESLLFWEKLGLGLAAGKIKGNPAIWIFTVCNRFPKQYSNNVKESANDQRVGELLRAETNELLTIARRKPA